MGARAEFRDGGRRVQLSSTGLDTGLGWLTGTIYGLLAMFVGLGAGGAAVLFFECTSRFERLGTGRWLPVGILIDGWDRVRAACT